MSRPTTRRSARSLVEIAQGLSQRDASILELLAEVRLVSARQIEALVFVNGSPLTTSRRTRHALARLHDLGLVGRLERRIGGVRAGSSGYIYRLSFAGRRLLGLPTSGWREPSSAFLEHTLAVVDVHVALARLGQAGVVEELTIHHEPHCWRSFTGPHGQPSALKPDLFVEYAQGQYAHPWFIEIDLGTEHRPAVTTKCQQYLAYLRTGKEQHGSGVFPPVLWVVPDKRRATVLRELIARLPEPAGQLFNVATTDDYLIALSGDLTPHERR